MVPAVAPCCLPLVCDVWAQQVLDQAVNLHPDVKCKKCLHAQVDLHNLVGGLQACRASSQPLPEHIQIERARLSEINENEAEES